MKKKKKKYDDPAAHLDEIMREAAKMADRAQWLSLGAILMGLLALALSLLRWLKQTAL